MSENHDAAAKTPDSFSRSPSSQESLKPGSFITPTVRLVKPLAEGGMGRVWVADHLGLESQVVVKVMAAEMAARADGAERFAREAAIAAAIKSPHVVQVFDHGVTASGGIPYIVMELLEGKDLGAHLTEHGRMDPIDVVTLVVQIAKALSKAHKAAIVHRDIKPDNIFLCDLDPSEHFGSSGASDGRRKEIFVKLLDFGTAKKGSGDATTPQQSSRTTIPGQIMGTPYYMSPEQSIGAELDERSDIWSLGVVVFEALTNRKPFDGPSLGAITIAIHGVLPKMSAFVPSLPGGLDDWFAKACAQKPEDRFASVKEATSAFIEAVTGSTPIEQPTESIALPYFPKPSATRRGDGSSTPVGAVTRSTHPQSLLIDTLPERGAERRVPTIAAALVLGVAALAMAGIVLNNRGASTTTSEATTNGAQVAPPPAAAPAPTPAPLPVVEPPSEPEPSEPAAPATHAKAKKPTPATATPAPAAASPIAKANHTQPAPKITPASAAHKDASAPPSSASSAAAGTAKPGTPATKPGEDDDLMRLANAASKQDASKPAEKPAEKPEKPAPPAIPPLPSE